MYHRKAWEQITMYDFNQGFGFPISEDNRWVQLSKKIHWDEAALSTSATPRTSRS